ncbi:MAG: hypothetical protein FWD68_02115 [Alphaproteobacteria bacterium]|nr:hypothetical protein [Alphaproteobacteria bacterium]
MAGLQSDAGRRNRAHTAPNRRSHRPFATVPPSQEAKALPGGDPASGVKYEILRQAGTDDINAFRREMNK